MSRTCVASILALGLCVGVSCRQRDLNFPGNVLVREYDTPADEVLASALDSLKAAELKVERERSDAFGGDIVARRANGDVVYLQAKSVSDNATRLFVRVGSGDMELAAMLHQHIVERLGMAKDGRPLFTGSTFQATYDTDLVACVNAARRTFEDMNVTMRDEAIHATRARIEGELNEETPVRIRCDALKGGQVRVVLSAGRMRSDGNEAYVQMMRSLFRQHLRPRAQP